jgi:hypothetical protein
MISTKLFHFNTTKLNYETSFSFCYNRKITLSRKNKENFLYNKNYKFSVFDKITNKNINKNKGKENGIDLNLNNKQDVVYEREEYQDEDVENEEDINEEKIEDYFIKEKSTTIKKEAKNHSNKNNDYKDDKDNNSFSFLDDLQQIISEIKCKGCGVDLQCISKEKLGYIPDKKVKEFIETKDKNNNSNNNYGNIEENIEEKENIKLEDYEIPQDRNFLKKLKTKKLKKNDLICERCFKLKHYMLINETNKKEIENLRVNNNTNINESLKSQEEKKFDHYSLLIKNIDVEKLINQIILRFNEKSFIFYLCVR